VDDAELFDRMLASLLASSRLVTGGSPSSRLIEREGLVAGVVPSTPNRSVFNSVLYTSPQTLTGELDELAGIYEQEGVRAWTVWVPERDRDVVALLEREGHSLDADPAAMVLELVHFDRQVAGEVEFAPAPQMADIAQLNDLAYGFDGDFVRALGQLPEDAAYRYVATLDGRPAAGMMTLDHNGDCFIAFVATRPEARGRGLATALMTRALLDARERGCATTSLQATKMGQPVYERLGYRDLGAIKMWERRRH
jgi:GNAT superfamily N-acetyltransferase